MLVRSVVDLSMMSLDRVLDGGYYVGSSRDFGHGFSGYRSMVSEDCIARSWCSVFGLAFAF